MLSSELQSAIASVPPGLWAVGVSGGADSVALLSMLRTRDDLSLRVAHLDHQTRQGESTKDANFVAELASQWSIPCDAARLDEIESMLAERPRNRSARFRAVRLAMFADVVRRHHLKGIILGHHADDQAETVFLRLLRGSGHVGLAAMSANTVIGGLLILRPLLKVSRDLLRQYLQQHGQSWREDQSNLSMRYARNRVRQLLQCAPQLREAMLELGQACGELRDWAAATALPGERLASRELQQLPRILAREMAFRWLVTHGSPPQELDSASLDRLILMANDAASPSRQSFPGGILVRRLRGILLVEELAAP